MNSHLQDVNNSVIAKLQIFQHSAMKVDWTMDGKPTEVKRALAVKKKKTPSRALRRRD